MLSTLVVQEYMLRAEFSLPSITSEESTPDKKAPIRVKFEIPYFTVSGIQVHCSCIDFVCFKLTVGITAQYIAYSIVDSNGSSLPGYQC